jgi:hypothetical protein
VNWCNTGVELRLFSGFRARGSVVSAAVTARLATGTSATLASAKTDS